jgi:hypothetical protein
MSLVELPQSLGVKSMPLFKYRVRTSPLQLAEIPVCCLHARNVADQLELCTIDFPDHTGNLDVEISSLISKDLKLNHQVVPWTRPHTEDLEEWTFRIGGSVGEFRGWQASTTCKTLRSDYAYLQGNAGEIAHGSHWRSSDNSSSNLTAQRLAAICGFSDDEQSAA